ncbi:MAG: tRNA (N(6)-L-threonylcarbamoyladenosine(37)-C(2))-methylthiotransferase MtaB [Bacteroidetes bacterium]|nr:MAG: tRNA (N(6)-L-threonylcarbamoyladenosine(37)-C(2))-methylthiotransferase MtaB [Bacteroidota bacterium]
MKRIAFQTLGCKLNFSETSTLSRQFGEEGFEQVEFSAPADIYVINSCSVTQNAEKRCKELIKKAMKKNPEAHVAIIGCFSQINPEEIRAIPGVDIVLGNADKFNLFEHIQQLRDKGETQTQDIAVEEPEKFVPGFSMDDRTRSFFKIQDGCDYFCAYCTIPLARGRSRSNNIAATIKTATEIARTNIKEVVLSGVNIGDFGKHHGENFYGFLQELIQVKGLERIRISSIEPDLLSDEIIELVAASDILMPHFHIPLQAGSDEVLKAMGRRYDTARFASRVELIRKHMPHACIAADLIVGFPAETDELFQQSYDFVRKTDISYVHVFTYSERDNTRAVKYDTQIPVKERNLRSKKMQQLSAHKKDVFYHHNQGIESDVLWEKDNVKGFMHGFTANYIKVKTPFDKGKANTIEKVTLNLLDEDGVYKVG